MIEQGLYNLDCGPRIESICVSKQDHNLGHGVVGVEVIPSKEEQAICSSTHAKVLIYQDGGRRRALQASHYHVKPCKRARGGNEVHSHKKEHPDNKSLSLLSAYQST